MSKKRHGSKSKVVNEKEFTLAARINGMDLKHSFIVSLISLIALVAVIIGTAFAPGMWVYDEGESYSCPGDATFNPLTKDGAIFESQPLKEDLFEVYLDHMLDSGKGLERDPISGVWFEDFEYDPAACRPFYQMATSHQDPIWYARVEGISPQNQKLWVHGYIHRTDRMPGHLDDKKFEFQYKLSIRGKDYFDEEWQYYDYGDKPQTISVHCKIGEDICSYFSIGNVQILEHQMYDVAIELHDSPTLSKLDATNIMFRIAFIDGQYTSMQLTVRIIFCLLSLVVLLIYATKVLCRIPKKMQQYLSHEQRGILALNFFLFLFNDPWYGIHIVKPNFFTYVLGEVQIALFAATLLTFWVRNVALIGGWKEQSPATEGKLSKILNNYLGYSKAGKCFLTTLFIIFVTDFMILYVLYFVNVDADPGFSYGHYSQLKKPLKGILIFTTILLILYFALFITAMVVTCKKFPELDKGSKAMLVFNCVIQVFFIFALAFGVFSRHFANGGALIFFYALMNFYVWILTYLYWPMTVKFTEYAISSDVPIEDQAAHIDNILGEVRNPGDKHEVESIELADMPRKSAREGLSESNREDSMADNRDIDVQF